MMDRRLFLTGLLAAAASAPAGAQDVGQWFAVTGDDGRPMRTERLPVELVSEIETLPGVIWTGAGTPQATIVEFFDYNCPFCRKAARDIAALTIATPDIRVGLVNNPILSASSMEAALVELAVHRSRDAATAYKLQERLFEQKGTIGRAQALDAAESLGLERAGIEKLTQDREVQAALKRQKTLAASLGLTATPSFVAGTAAILGYPGPRSLGRVVSALRQCDQVTC